MLHFVSFVRDVRRHVEQRWQIYFTQQVRVTRRDRPQTRRKTAIDEEETGVGFQSVMQVEGFSIQI